MKYLKKFNESIFDNKRDISSNVIQYELDQIDDNIIKSFKDKYPEKWILPSTEYGANYIFVKDKPRKFIGNVPDKLYHVSEVDNLDEIGINPSTKTDSPFGYYDISFFYLDIEDAKYGSISYIDGENYLYEIDSKSTKNWLEAINEPLDGEENITTSDYIEPKYIKKL